VTESSNPSASSRPATSPDPPDPADQVARIDAMASGFQEAQVVLTAVRLGVFEALEGAAGDGEDPPGAGQLAERLGADPRGVRILCDALAALGLLVREPDGDGGRYRNSPAARQALLPGAPRSKVAMLLHRARLYERWAKLADAVVTGARVPDDAIDPRLDASARAFAHAMADVARDSAVKTVDALERAGVLDGVRHVLDVGGGPGHYAVELARRVPAARATVLDRAETLTVTRETIAAAGLDERVTTRPGDAYGGDLAPGRPEDDGPYDLIFTSNMIHIYPAEANRRLVRDAAGALAPGGRLAIKDFLLDPDRTGPPGAALFAVNMLVSTEGGDCYTLEQVAGWCREAGLEPEDPIEITEKSRIALARNA
jgi:SAM-dependent methyltransferase